MSSRCVIADLLIVHFLFLIAVEETDSVRPPHPGDEEEEGWESVCVGVVPEPGPSPEP